MKLMIMQTGTGLIRVDRQHTPYSLVSCLWFNGQCGLCLLDKDHNNKVNSTSDTNRGINQNVVCY